MLSETDAPYAAPVPHRGQRNEPVFVAEVVKKIAEIRGEEEGTVTQQIIQNTQRIFNCV
jgi:TatD DNase family protein